MATKKATTELVIPALDLRTITLRVVGKTPLIEHVFAQKAKQEILDKQMQVAKKGRTAKNPVEDFIESLYWIEGKPTEMTEEAFEAAVKNGAKFGFPAIGFKAAAVSAGYRAGITKDKVSMNGAFHILCDLVEIKGTPHMREDMVRVGMGTADVRHRGEFTDWEAEITIQYNASVISAQQLANLFNIGGFACGIGEWRPEKGGNNGMFAVA